MRGVPEAGDSAAKERYQAECDDLQILCSHNLFNSCSNKFFIDSLKGVN